MTSTVQATMRRDQLPADCREAAALLNQGCICRSVDSRRLKRALEAGGVAHEALSTSHPHLFSHTQVYVAQVHLDFMADLIRAIERVVALSGWQVRVLADAPAIAGHIHTEGCVQPPRPWERGRRSAPRVQIMPARKRKLTRP